MKIEDDTARKIHEIIIGEVDKRIKHWLIEFIKSVDNIGLDETMWIVKEAWPEYNKVVEGKDKDERDLSSWYNANPELTLVKKV
jgi:hypothetical protein